MASIQPHPKGYRAQIKVGKRRASRVLPTKKAAQKWAMETELLLSDTDAPSKAPFSDIMDRYAETVSAKKKGARWEVVRLNLLSRHQIAAKPLRDITPADIAQWRDDRLRQVSASSVRREMTLLRHVFEIARRDWHLIDKSPAKEVTRPTESAPRDRLILPHEVDTIVDSLGYIEGQPVEMRQHLVAVAFMLAIETGMRAGELLKLTPLNIAGRVYRVPDSKTGQPRNVPLSSRAMALIAMLPDEGFRMTTEQLSSLFRKGRIKAGITDVTFHDARHLATTRLAKKLDVLDLARMLGMNVQRLMTYYNRSADDIAGDLD